MFNPYHEIGLDHFVEHMNDILGVDKLPSKLKKVRLEKQMTQQNLASIAGVPIRTIQQYEQRQKSINKASAETVYLLAEALGCDIKDILE